MDTEWKLKNKELEKNHDVMSKSNKHMTLNLKKIKKKISISTKNQMKNAVQVKRTIMKSKKNDFSYLSDESNAILSELPIQIDDMDFVTEKDEKMNYNDQFVETSLTDEQRTEREIIENFDLSLIAVAENENISSTKRCQNVIKSVQETSPPTLYNTIPEQNLWIEPISDKKNCRRCLKLILYDIYTLECACNDKPVYHKMCVQVAWEISKRSGIQFTCLDCSTPIQEIFYLDSQQILTSIKNIQEKSDFILR